MSIVEEVAPVVNIHFCCTCQGTPQGFSEAQKIHYLGFDTPLGACYTGFVTMLTILPGRVRQPFYREAGPMAGFLYSVAGETQLRWLDAGAAGSKTARGGQNVG